MLTCAGCSLASSGPAWHWIAILRPVSGGAEAVCYCPVCAEAKFRYFSRHRAERLAYGDEHEG